MYQYIVLYADWLIMWQLRRF